MIPLNLADIVNAVDGELVGKKGVATNNIEQILVEQISTDSRALQQGEMFLALKGPNFDGHKFISYAQKLGCCAVIVDHQVDVNISQVIVKDTRIALGQIAAYVKQKVAPKTVGITGSSGKTTVKEMVSSILARLGKVHATKGNFNNDIGVPLTLLGLEQDHDFAVVEMGANHMGEIAYTTGLVKPDVAIINNIAAAHLEGFGDLCGVARAKGEIFEGLPPNGVAIYNQDCKYVSKWQWRLVDKTIRSFSCKKPCRASIKETVSIFSSAITLDGHGRARFQLTTPIGETYIQLTVPGIHNVCNAVAAAAIALEFGATLADIQLGLADMMPVKGRLNLYQLDDNCKLIDDSYNANVESIKAATDLLAGYAGKRILILGDMAELGSVARSYHQEVGEYARIKGIDTLLTLGVLSQSSSDAFNGTDKGQVSADVMQSLNMGKGKVSQHFSSREQLFLSLQQLLAEESEPIAILVKGSRSAHMEHVVEKIIAWRTHDASKVAEVKL